jgi:hypothetical protein
MKINLNDTIRFTPTEKGIARFRLKQGYPPKVASDGTVQTQLWILIATYGPVMHIGMSVSEYLSTEIEYPEELQTPQGILKRDRDAEVDARHAAGAPHQDPDLAAIRRSHYEGPLKEFVVINQQGIASEPITIDEAKHLREIHGYRIAAILPWAAEQETKMQYRVLWDETFPAHPNPIPFSGRVYSERKRAEVEYSFKVHEHRLFSNVRIESRPASDQDWPRPWDVADSANEPVPQATDNAEKSANT